MKKLLTVIAIAELLCGCAVYRIPTPCGMATIKTFCTTADIPKFSESNTNGYLNLEGYTTKGDAAVITASSDALGQLVGAAIKAGIAAGAIP
jgi:hypothetical protein